MATVSDIYNYLCEIAPLRLAEDYDNPGLLVGEPDSSVKKALLSLDITSETAKEAETGGAQLIISHHPVIFKPVRKVVSSGPASVVWNLAKRSISAVCMHTNLDTANGGVNDVLAQILDLSDIKILSDDIIINFKKVSVFVPDSHAEKVRLAMARAGAGKLGQYDGCAFETEGKGYFRPLQGAKPYIGESGKPEKVNETRIEAICAPQILNNVISEMLKAHPYEVPAYDIFEDEAVCEKYGIGRIGTLKQELPLREFATRVKKKLDTCCVKVTDAGKIAKTIALCSGAVDEEIIMKAAKAGADTIVTGEMKHNLYYTALNYNINVVEAGHFATETVILPSLKQRLENKFPGVIFEIAKGNVEPFYVV
ncbi:MAG TPA: Nif3-like dinuclear metal center hexameric protein [Ruminiclostridium sp.]|nr:Nif3-like dinuclear metal center hexameric protein [Ruminiclostridium sp.]